MAYVFDPKEIDIYWSGVAINGFAAGTFISIEFGSPQWNTVEGLDGNVAFLPKNNLSATCTITLQQGSFANKNLTQSLSTQNRDLSQLEQSNLTITEPSGTYNLKFDNAIIKNQPSVSYGSVTEDGTREWVFYSPNVTYLETVNEVTRGQSTLSSLVSSVFSLF